MTTTSGTRPPAALPTREELEACPWCGEAVDTGYTGGLFFVECRRLTGCQARGPARLIQREAHKAWNDLVAKLAAVDALEGDNARLREIERAAREYVAALADSVPTTALRIDRIKSGHAALARALAAAGEGEGE